MDLQVFLGMSFLGTTVGLHIKIALVETTEAVLCPGISIQCNAMNCTARQCKAKHCRAMQCNGMQCDAMSCKAQHKHTQPLP